MLITYSDSMGKDLKDLYEILGEEFEGVIEGVHILPFFPSSGDRGFAPITYDVVDPVFGDWEDIKKFSEKYYLMCDFMINHISVQSDEFQDYMKNKEKSPFKEMFVHWNEFWDGEPTEEQMQKLYMRKGTGPFKDCTFEDGSTVRLWNTFGPEQIDLDWKKDVTKDYYNRTLTHLAQHVPLIRFDALAYASKRPDTSCFFVEPEVWDVLKIGTEPLKPYGVEALSEIHENYKIQLAMAEKGYWVYDFCLPMLLLHGLKTGRVDRLANWLRIAPRKQFTTLDTHDGIGVVDVTYMLEEDEIQEVCDDVMEITKEARKYLPAKFASMLKAGGIARRYQLNCTYYSALHENDDAYLLARIVQFFTPGIPQVYYVGLLAGTNDMELLEKTNGADGRNINRHYYTKEEIHETVQRPMLQRMYEIMKFRNTYPVFNGKFEVEEGPEQGQITMTWSEGELFARLQADFRDFSYEITYYDPESKSVKVK